MYAIIFFECWLCSHTSFSCRTIAAYTAHRLWAQMKYKGYFVNMDVIAHDGVIIMSDLRDRANFDPPPEDIKSELRNLLCAEVEKRNVIPLAANGLACG